MASACNRYGKKTSKKESLRIDSAISRFQEEELEQPTQHIDTLFSDDYSSELSIGGG